MDTKQILFWLLPWMAAIVAVIAPIVALTFHSDTAQAVEERRLIVQQWVEQNTDPYDWDDSDPDMR